MTIRILGVMTGTSCDGLDAACVEFETQSSTRKPGLPALHSLKRLSWSASAPYPARLRVQVIEIQNGRPQSIHDLLAIERALSHWYGSVVKRMIRGRPIDLIAMHGQTVAHFPEITSTWQMGNAAMVAETTGLSVASRFRDGDLAAGGQGAPLLPLFHLEIDRALGGRRAIHNIGGISNLTYFGNSRQPTAFDTGPGNIWIDAAAAHATRGKAQLDRNGRLARMGEADHPAVEKILRLSYFKKAPPKSTGRDDFPFELLLRNTRARGADLVATATEITVESIARAYETWLRIEPPREVLICGGGAYNSYLLKRLSERLDPLPVRSIRDAGWDPSLIEAQGFALFGMRSLRGLTLGGSWTGARRFGPPAAITPGKNWASLLRKLSGH